MDRWVENDTTLKVLAVGLALILWVQVTGERQRPEVQRAFENMPVAWRYLESDVAVLDVEPSSVTIVVRGERSVMDFLSRHDLDPVVNLRGAPPGSTSVYVSVSVPKGVQLVEVSPDIVSVNLEEIREKLVEPEIQLLGQPQEDYEADIHRLHPPQVTVRGGQSMVDKVAGLEGTLDVSGQSESFSRSVPLRAVGEDGLPIQDISFSPAEITVDVDVSPRQETRAFPIKVIVEGDLPEGYSVQDVEVYPDEVQLTGSVFLLGDISEIETEPVDLEGLTESVELEVELVAPSGTYLELDEPVRVRIEIQSES